jgi:hypothetical protein
MRKSEEEIGGGVVNIDTARVPRTEDERRLLAAGWLPKERCGPLELTIWANPATGFYCSQEVALHRLMQRSGRPDLEASDIPSSSVMRKLRASVKMAQGKE